VHSRIVGRREADDAQLRTRSPKLGCRSMPLMPGIDPSMTTTSGARTSIGAKQSYAECNLTHDDGAG